jgi:peptidoglycan L-alanyl-D-glutamate endopeptidase CwlK
MTYALGTKSKSRLKGVHPDMVKVVERAIQITTQDFTVQEGLRTLATQQEYLKRGVTKTLKSKHLKQPDGYSHAVDLVPMIAGQPRWEVPACYPIAEAMRQAAKELGVKIVFGALWDRDLANTTHPMKKEVADYCTRHPGPDFVDAVHYQLG